MSLEALSGILVCPRCRGPLRISAGYTCLRCDAHYPVVAGIADFRVAPDPWIGLVEDREKALRVEEATRGMSFGDAVRTYWEMTPTTPAPRAAAFVAHALRAEERSREWLEEVAREGRDVPAGPWLDLGCGTADLAAVVASSGRRVVGIDIALRWLVVARKRPGVEGRVALVCCCAERLPFAEESFARVLSLGMLEHCANARDAIREARRTTKPGGELRLRTVNRYSLLPEPHVGVWGVGYVPRKWADSYVRRRSGQRYLHHRPLSPRELGRSLASAGFAGVTVRPAYLLRPETEHFGARLRPAIEAYRLLRGGPLTGPALSWVAPQLEVSGTIPRVAARAAARRSDSSAKPLATAAYS